MNPTDLSAAPLPENTPEPTTPPQQELSEAQLRDAYDAEEIERFLSLFSTYVEEVRLPSTTGPPVSHIAANSISAHVANRLLLPILAPRPAPEFTLNRFRLAGQRLYLAIVPHYLPFIAHSNRLASWEDWRKSAALCIGFWFLWWHDLLPAAPPIYLLFVLLKNRFLPYPSFSELKQHREEIHDADRFGEQLYRRLSSNSFGVKDAWRLCNLVVFPSKEKEYSEQSRIDISGDGTEPHTIEGGNDSEEIRQLKRLFLYLMNETADLHERAKNIFIWRKPASSWLYSCLLVALSIIAFLAPARYILKTIFGAAGFFYWHITPVMLALPFEDRLRLPSPLSNVPNDFEYAMEMISQRLAAGLEISPSKFAKSSGTRSAGMPDLNTTGSEQNLTAVRGRRNPIDRMGQAIDSGMTFLHDGKRFLTKVPDEELRSERPPNASSSSTLSTLYKLCEKQKSPECVLAFPAQHSSAPGMITLTPNKLYFTSLVSLDPKVVIPLRDITCVKKVGLLKGLDISSSVVDSDGREVEKQERFIWISNRDELFARIASGDNKTKWMKM